MHDCKGRELHVGDRVMIPCVVKDVYPSAGFFNVTLESVATLPPLHGGAFVTSAINTVQVLRANDGDDVGYEVIADGKARVIR